MTRKCSGCMKFKEKCVMITKGLGWIKWMNELKFVAASTMWWRKILLVSEIPFTVVIWYVKVKAKWNVSFCQKNRNRPSLITLMRFSGTRDLIYIDMPFLIAEVNILFRSFSSFYLCLFIYSGLVELVLGLWFSRSTEINSQNSRNKQYLHVRVTSHHVVNEVLS